MGGAQTSGRTDDDFEFPQPPRRPRPGSICDSCSDERLGEEGSVARNEVWDLGTFR